MLGPRKLSKANQRIKHSIKAMKQSLVSSNEFEHIQFDYNNQFVALSTEQLLVKAEYTYIKTTLS